MAFANDVTTLIALRFAAGLGLGGAMPNAAALASEYVPLRRRPFAVTLTVVCIPLGGTLAGFTGAVILPAYGWRALFFVGGVLPLVLAALLWKVLPESPRYLARNRTRWPELAALLRRLGHDVPPDAHVRRFARTGGRARVGRVALRAGVPPRHAGALRGVLLLPAVRLHRRQLGARRCSRAPDSTWRWPTTGSRRSTLAASSAPSSARCVFARLGSRVTMLAMTAGAIGGCLLLASVPIGEQSTLALLAMLAWTGGSHQRGADDDVRAWRRTCIPAAIRATGVGTAVAVGRVGGIGSPYAGAWALESGPSQLFALLAGTLTIVFAALASVRNHIPSSFALRAPRPMAEARQ